jgi:phage FluMu protein Com
MEEIRCKKCNRLLMKLNGRLFVDIPKAGMYLESEIKCPKCRYTTKYDILNKLQGNGIGWSEDKPHIEF